MPVVVASAHEDQAWYKTLMSTPTPLHPIHEGAMVSAKMSRLWPFPNLEPYYEKTDKSPLLSLFCH